MTLSQSNWPKFPTGVRHIPLPHKPTSPLKCCGAMPMLTTNAEGKCAMGEILEQKIQANEVPISLFVHKPTFPLKTFCEMPILTTKADATKGAVCNE